MGLIYDNPRLAALTLTRRRLRKSKAPVGDQPMHTILDGLMQRNGAYYLTDW